MADAPACWFPAAADRDQDRFRLDQPETWILVSDL